MVAAAETKTNARGATISVLAKVKARNLYLNQGLSVPTVAKEVGVSEAAIRKWADREGWAAERRAVYSRLVQKQDARTDANRSAVVEAIASEAEEHALSAMRNVGESLKRSDEFAAKDFQAYTAGVKNLASTARMLREDSSGSKVEGSRLELNLFFMGQQPTSQQPKQVVEVETKSVQ